MFKRKESGQIMLLLLVIVFIASFLLAGGVLPKKGKIVVPNEKLVATEKKAGSSEESLQLDKLAFMTVSPSPSPAPTSPPVQPPAGGDQPIPPKTPSEGGCEKGESVSDRNCFCEEYKITCTAGNCNSIENGPLADPPLQCDTQGGQPITFKDMGEYYCAASKEDGLLGGETGTFCLSKPIIYLYPLEKTFVNVSVETPGKVVISDPFYPNGGWKNVEAHPDGTLFYQGRKYRELYYETNVSKVNPPKNGLIIPIGQIRQTLILATTKLGLNTFEQKEFLEYWVPKLKGLNSPYILFSILEKEEKERVDKIIISPEPDTRIEFIAYFKPFTRSKVEGLTPLILPNDPPKRIGFTAVEWGGTIDPD